MRRSSKRITAAILAMLLTVSTVFSDVQIVRAEENITVQEDTTEQSSVIETEESTDSESEESTVSEEEDVFDQSQKNQTSDEEKMNKLAIDQKETCATVTASVGVGEVEEGTKISLSCATDGAEIKYNTDGSSEYGKYTSEITINEDTTIYAFASKEDMEDSEVVSFEYTVKQNPQVQTAREGVFFSEYVEGSGNNKALEIYNGTGSTIDLSDYSVKIYTNGAENNYYQKSLPEGISLNAGEVYVLYHSSMDQTVISALGEKGTTGGNTVNFNGNDPLELYHGEVLIDAIGTVGSSDNYGKDITLERKENITTGNPVYDASEWDVLAKDTFTHLGTRFGVTDGTQEPAEDEYEVISIADARKAAINTANLAVKGIVTLIDGKNVFVQDETAGICAFFATAPTDLSVGDTITVKGTRAAYNGLEEIKDAKILEIDKASAEQSLPSKEVTLQELVDDYAAEGNLESTRVYLKSLMVGKKDSYGNPALSDEAGNCVNTYKATVLSQYEECDFVDVYAVVGENKDGLQLRIANKESEVTAVYDTISIADARAAEINTTDLFVKGIIVFIDGKNVYIQDKTAGIDVYYGKSEVTADISIGDIIYVKGVRAVYNGLQELSSPEVIKVVKGNAEKELPATEVTIKEILESTGEYQATRVYLKNVTLGKINTGETTSITDEAGNSINVYKIPAPAELTEGTKVNLYAIVGDYKNAVQLRVASADDIEVVENKEPADKPDLYDPISDEMIKSVENGISVKDAAALTSGTATVVGQVVYKYVSNATDTSFKNIILEDVIDGEVYGYLVYDYNHATDYEVGNIVALTGTAIVYSGVPELKDVTEVKVLSNADAIEAQEVTVSQLGADYLSEYICIKDAELGTYNATESTPIKDATGTINIFKAVAFPEGVTEGSVVDVYAACTAYNTTYQLKNATSADYKVGGAVEIDDSIVLQAASFAGTAKIDENVTEVNADLYADNDMLDANTTFSVYKGGSILTKPLIENGTKDQTTGITTYTYSLGSNKGLQQDDYFLIKTDASYYGNLELSFITRASGSAAKNFVVEYSTDGENFEACGKTRFVTQYYKYSADGAGEEVKVDKTTENGEFSFVSKDPKVNNVTVQIPGKANGAKTLYIRVRVKDNTRVDGKASAIGNTATNYMNGILIKGNPIISDTMCQYVKVSPEAGETSVNQELTFTTGTKGADIYYRFDADDAFHKYSADEKPVIKELPCHVTVYATKEGLKDGVKTSYTFTQKKVETVKISPNGGAVALGTKVKLSCATEGATIYYAIKKDENATNEPAVTSLEDDGIMLLADDEEYDWVEYTEPVTLDTLPCTLYTKATLEGCLDSAVKTAGFTKRTNEKYNIYFGQMHAHTNYSDGAGSCEEAFEYAKNSVSNLDFLCVTDHSNSYDNADSASINDGSMSTEWVEGHELAAKYTDDTFVGIMGFEMTWSNGLGHMNTFNSDGFQSRTQTEYKTYATALNNYYNALQTAPDSISQFNHPGTTFGDFQDFAYYSTANDSLITLIEVGNGEGEIGSSGYFPSYEYYQRALDKGWHVSPTNNQDNHKGKWGSANTARSVVLADSLTEENIYDAMRNNRVYATEDNDLSIYYTLDGNVMGSILDKDMVGDKLTLSVDLSDPTDAKIGKVQVIVNGGLVVASQIVDTNETNVTFEVDNKYSFYYIKVTEADGDIAVTAPVWVGEVEAVGINGISTTTTLPIKDEAIDVTLDLYNNEKTDLELQSIIFSVDGEIVKAVDLAAENLTKVVSETTADYTFSYTHHKVGAMTMDVEVKAALNGVEKVYTDKLQLTYVSNDLVAHVVIDGSHYNDYVTGYYGGNMGNFITMAAEKNVKAEIVTETFTQETLKDVDMLIVSAPGKKTGTANAGDYKPSHFEDSFLEIVKDYVAQGGTVIVCGLADYQDTTDSQCATETNKLLEAIGSTIRMNSDEAIDEVNNGGQEYRMYFRNFNMDNPYMKGVITGNDGQTYSAYSGCTVDITNAGENEIVEEAVALVRGFETTYSKNCKNDDGTAGDNAVDVEKGNVVALACQETKAGGMIFVGGTVFMSDFEVKAELDNNDSLPYANYTLMNNILETKKVVMPVSDIATVRKGNMGDPFAIEGYVANGTDNEFTKFFDTIYVEDATGGITVFPFAAEGVKKGTKIRVVGYVDQYQGDKELQITSYEILDAENLKEIVPTKRTTKEATDYDQFGGSFIEVTGKVVDIYEENGVVSEFWVMDDSGVSAAVFIDGYIYSGTTGKNEIAEFVKEGATVSAAGFLYLHPEGANDESVPVLRVPDCDGIKLVKAAPDSDVNIPDNGNNNSTSTDASAVVTTPTTDITNNKGLTNIFEENTALAGSIEEMTGHKSFVLSEEKKLLQVEILMQYFSDEKLPIASILDVYTGKDVGFSFMNAGNSSINANEKAEMNLGYEKKEVPGNAVYFKPDETKAYRFAFVMHMNLGEGFVGKHAKIFTRSTANDEFVLRKEMTVADNGNVCLTVNETCEVIVLMEE